MRGVMRDDRVVARAAQRVRVGKQPAEAVDRRRPPGLDPSIAARCDRWITKRQQRSARANARTSLAGRVAGVHGVVVSGLARGVDRAADEAALEGARRLRCLARRWVGSIHLRTGDCRNA